MNLRQSVQGIPSEAELLKAIKQVAVMFKAVGQELTAEDEEKIKTILSARIVIDMDMGIKIIDGSTYRPWLAHRKADIDEFYWNRYPCTDIISDFDIKKLQALNFSVRSISDPIIFVVKINTTVLKHLLSWINTSYKDTRSEKIDVPLLLIDDEADNASVNTKKPEDDPTATNSSIRKILSVFNRHTYVAVTATPFANIFIDPTEKGDMDCLSSHKMKIISEMVEAVGANVLYLPQYSPDLNPIETVFSQVKSDLRNQKPRSVEAICDSLTYAFYSITPEQAANHFRNCFCTL